MCGGTPDELGVRGRPGTSVCASPKLEQSSDIAVGPSMDDMIRSRSQRSVTDSQLPHLLKAMSEGNDHPLHGKGAPIQIFVKTPTGGLVTFRVNTNMSAALLKAKVCESQELPVASHQLQFRGKKTRGAPLFERTPPRDRERRPPRSTT